MFLTINSKYIQADKTITNFSYSLSNGSFNIKVTFALPFLLFIYLVIKVFYLEILLLWGLFAGFELDFLLIAVAGWAFIIAADPSLETLEQNKTENLEGEGEVEKSEDLVDVQKTNTSSEDSSKTPDTAENNDEKIEGRGSEESEESAYSERSEESYKPSAPNNTPEPTDSGFLSEI